MGAIKPDSRYQTPREKAIAHALAQPEVNQQIAEKYIAACCAEIQSRWTERERQSRCRWAHGGEVETPVIHHDHRRKGVGQVVGE